MPSKQKLGSSVNYSTGCSESLGITMIAHCYIEKLCNEFNIEYGIRLNDKTLSIR
jgi:hypothetical protein